MTINELEHKLLQVSMFIKQKAIRKHGAVINWSIVPIVIKAHKVVGITIVTRSF